LNQKKIRTEEQKQEIEKVTSAIDKLPDEIQEIVKDAPPKVKEAFFAWYQMTSKQSRIHPIFDKFESKHVDKFLDYCHKDDENQYKLISSNRWFYLIYSILFMGIFIFLTLYLLPKDKNLLTDIFKFLGGLVSGIGIGYGLRSKIKPKNSM